MALIHRLLDGSVPVTELPHGFRVVKILRLPVPTKSPARAYHMVGNVEVQVVGPDSHDFYFFYIGVFPSIADARGQFPAKPYTKAKLSPVPPRSIPGFESLHPRLWAGTLNFRGADYGVSIGRILPPGIAEVAASTVTPLQHGKGDEHVTLELLASGLRYLASAETSAGG